MVTPEQITAIGAVISPVVVGIVALAGFRHESGERRRERRLEFQRDSIITLQESAWALRATTVEMVSDLRKYYQEIDIRQRHNFSPPDRVELFKRAAKAFQTDGLESEHTSAHLRMVIDETRIADSTLVSASKDLRTKAGVVWAFHRDALLALESGDDNGFAFASMEKKFLEYLDMHHLFNRAAKRALGEFVGPDR